MRNNNTKANKGEWSEFYAFLKILEQRQLPAADKNLNPIAGKFFVFQKVIREEKDESVKVYDFPENGPEIIITNETGLILKKVSRENLKSKTLSIFKKIKAGKSAAFEIPEAHAVMEEFLCTKVKASNDKKADIVAVIYDRISETMPMLGFSVKSMIGGASTLLNAGKTTNFVFSVDGFRGTVDAINIIDGKSKIRNRLSAIIEQGGVLSFDHVSNDAFASNLKNIDTAFPKFIAQMLVDYFLGKASSVIGLVNELSKNDRFNKEFGLSSSGYELKIKNFLDSVALGMVPSVEWDGFTKAHGGYIVVKEDGEVLCYHLYNRDEFRSYLYENTKFESASSTRHDYGTLYEKDGRLFFNLNLQIRFLR